MQTNDSMLMGNNPLPFQDYQQIEQEGHLPTRVFLTVGHEEVGPESTSEHKALAVSDTEIKETSLVSCDRAKLWTDGAVGARTAALLEPYSDDPENVGHMLPTEDLDKVLKKLKENGFRLEAHAIGDRAADELLKSMIKNGFVPEDRPVLTHCQILSADIIKRMAAQGVIGNIQPQFVPSDAAGTVSRFGNERLPFCYCWKTMRDAGVVLAGGSDCPVEEPRPLHGIYYAMTHASAHGKGHAPLIEKEQMSFAEALEMYTIGASVAVRMEHRLGLLEKGYDADFVITTLSADVDTNPDQLLSADVDAVYIKGGLTYDKSVGFEGWEPPKLTADSYAPGKNGLLQGWGCPCCIFLPPGVSKNAQIKINPLADPLFCPVAT